MSPMCRGIRRAVLTVCAVTACTAAPRGEAAPASGAAATAGAERGASPGATVVPGIDAVYVLGSIEGRALPAAADEPSGDRRLEVLAETLWLRPDGSFVG